MNSGQFLKNHAPEIFVFFCLLFSIATEAKGITIAINLLILGAMILARILKKEH